MNKLIQPANLLLYLLTIITFFLLGMSFAGITGAAKTEGLTGGAIVFWYGVIFSATAFSISLIFAYLSERRAIVITNYILGIMLSILSAVIIIRAVQVLN